MNRLTHITSLTNHQILARMLKQVLNGGFHVLRANLIEGDAESGNQKRVRLAGHDQSLAGVRREAGFLQAGKLLRDLKYRQASPPFDDNQILDSIYRCEP